MSRENAVKLDWLNTDDNQRMLIVSDNEFVAINIEEFKGRFVLAKQEINVDEYTPEELEKYVGSYYKDLEEVKSIYNSDWKLIVAEIISEVDFIGEPKEIFNSLDELGIYLAELGIEDVDVYFD